MKIFSKSALASGDIRLLGLIAKFLKWLCCLLTLGQASSSQWAETAHPGLRLGLHISWSDLAHSSTIGKIAIECKSSRQRLSRTKAKTQNWHIPVCPNTEKKEIKKKKKPHRRNKRGLVITMKLGQRYSCWGLYPITSVWNSRIIWAVWGVAYILGVWYTKVLFMLYLIFRYSCTLFTMCSYIT